MKVDIKHSEKTTGLIFKKNHYFVTLRVQFNEEELQIINENDLGHAVILERGPPSTVTDKSLANEDWDLKIIKLVKRGEDTYSLTTKGEAKHYADVLMNAMKDCKEYIDDNADIGDRDKSVEF